MISCTDITPPSIHVEIHTDGVQLPEYASSGASGARVESSPRQARPGEYGGSRRTRIRHNRVKQAPPTRYPVQGLDN